MKGRTLSFAVWLCRGAAMLLGVTILNAAPQDLPYTTWSDYGGSADSMQYSALAQINKANVAQLERAWFYAVPGEPSRLAFNPLVVGDVMYVAGPKDVAVPPRIPPPACSTCEASRCQVTGEWRWRRHGRRRLREGRASSRDLRFTPSSARRATVPAGRR